MSPLALDADPPRSRRQRFDWRARLGLAPAREDQLAAARLDFADALLDVRSEASLDLQSRAARARSLHELWHLREPAFSLIARRHSQAEAARRLRRLDRHFA